MPPADAPSTEPTPARARYRRGEGGRLRTDLLDAAQRLLGETGSEASVTIRAVTRAAGVAPQSFYLHFASLDDLLFALYERGHDAFRAALEAAVAAEDDPRSRLGALCVAYLAYAREHRGAYRLLMGTVGRSHPGWDPEQLPGSETFGLLRDAIATAGPQLADDRDVLITRTSLLWTQLHGIAALTADRPTFPWPSDDALVAGAVDAAVRTRP